MKWGLRAQKGRSEFGGACLQGGVDRSAVLCDKHGGGANRGFGLAPL